MKILIYGINYYPEMTGVGKFTYEMSTWLASRGHDIRVITAPPYYPNWRIASGYSAWRYSIESKAGIMVSRAPLWVPFLPGGVKRLIHLASFALSSLPLIFRHLFWRPDVVWVVAPALFCAPSAWLAARMAGARCWLHIQDFELDAAFEMGILKGGILRALALRMERWLLSRFDKVSTISPRMMEHLHRKGLTEKDVFLFPNWVNTEFIRPQYVNNTSGHAALKVINRYRSELSIAPDAIVALYSGNMGQKQGLEILTQSARLTTGRNDLVWVFCGEGLGRANLERDCSGLANVRFLPLQPIEQLNELLNFADIHLLPQRADVADLVMPSKLTGMLASGRPVIATAQPGTQVAGVCEQCGLVVPSGDERAFVDATLLLTTDAALRSKLGIKARAYAEFHYAFDAILSRFESELLVLKNK